MSTLSKICGRCCNSKPITAFGVDRSRRDGLSLYCRGCKKRANSADYAAHRQARVDAEAARLAAHREAINAARRERHAVAPEIRRAQVAAYQAANRETVNEGKRSRHAARLQLIAQGRTS